MSDGLIGVTGATGYLGGGVARGGRAPPGPPPPGGGPRPDTAAFPARAGGGHTLVELTDAGRRLLGEHLPAAPGDHLAVEVWFSVSSRAEPEVLVHVGETEVGGLDAAATARYLPDITAAARVHDEQVHTSGTAFRTGDATVRLQVRLPPA